MAASAAFLASPGNLEAQSNYYDMAHPQSRRVKNCLILGGGLACGMVLGCLIPRQSSKVEMSSISNQTRDVSHFNHVVTSLVSQPMSNQTWKSHFDHARSFNQAATSVLSHVDNHTFNGSKFNLSNLSHLNFSDELVSYIDDHDYTIDEELEHLESEIETLQTQVENVPALAEKVHILERRDIAHWQTEQTIENTIGKERFFECGQNYSFYQDPDGAQYQTISLYVDTNKYVYFSMCGSEFDPYIADPCENDDTDGCWAGDGQYGSNDGALYERGAQCSTTVYSGYTSVTFGALDSGNGGMGFLEIVCDNDD